MIPKDALRCVLFSYSDFNRQIPVYPAASNFCYSEERSDEKSPVTMGLLHLPSVAQDD